MTLRSLADSGFYGVVFYIGCPLIIIGLLFEVLT